MSEKMPERFMSGNPEREFTDSDRDREDTQEVMDRPRRGRPLEHMAMRRMTSREALERRLHTLRREVDGLESLLKSLPLELPEKADQYLMSLALHK